MDPFNRLVRLTARAFYDDIAATKSGKKDDRGLAVVVLDALTRRQWVRDEDLAKDLRLSTKQLRRILRIFEEDRLVKRDHMKESAKIYPSAAVAATADGHHTGRDEQGKIKLHTYSYCCLDYAQIYDVVRYRMRRMKMNIKNQLEERITIQQYLCPNCNRRYTALDALYLVSVEDEFFHCEHCNGELVVESDKLAAAEMGVGDDNATKRRRQKFKDLLQKFEETLRPLTDVLNRVKDLPVPDFKTLQEWKVEAYAAARSNGDANDPSKSYNGTPMPSLGETKVEVALPDFGEKGANASSENTSTPTKVLPPWMIKKGMVLTDEQRGEVRQESNMKGASAAAGLSDDKKSVEQKDEKNSQVAYLEAYYALYQKQQEQAEANQRKQEPFNTTDDSTSRQVGMKSKRGYNDDDDDGDEDVEWEEAPLAGQTLDLNAKSENTSTPTKVLPPRMIKKGMVLTDEQRGEVKQESNMKGASAAAGLSDDKKSVEQKDEKNSQVAYLEAYYAALYQKQQEQEEANQRKQEPFNTTDDSTSRQVGMKSKRGYNDDDDDGDEYVEWEEAPIAGQTLDLNAKSENTSTPTKVLPPRMIKKGMVLTDEQRGEVKQELNMVGASAAAGLSDDKKSIDDEKNLQLAYLEAYYTALYQRQQEQEESNRRKHEPFNSWWNVGLKC